MIKGLLYTAICIMITTGVFAQKLSVKEYKLENGLTVLLHENHNAPEVFGAILVKAGGKNDPKNATGMAHYQEHMLFKGTEGLGTVDWKKEKQHIDAIFKLYDELGETTDEEKRKEIQKKINEESVKAAKYAIPNELSNIIKSMGGTKLNAGTGTDMTVFYNQFPPSEINKWIDLYAHRFHKPVFRSFQAELEVVYEEKNMYQDMFIFPLLENFNKHFYKNHPYGQQTLIGTSEDLKNPSLTKMYEFFKTYYVANNMVLIMSGDFDTEKTIETIKEKFKILPSGKIPEQQVYKEEPFNGREFVEKRLSPIKLGMLGFRTVPNGHKDELALEVCYNLLSNQNQTGLLNKLSLENKIMEAMVLPMHQLDHGAAIFLIIPKIIGQKLDDAESLVLGAIDSLKNGNFDDAVLKAVKNEMLVAHMKSFESNQNIALAIGMQYLQNKSIDELNAYPEKINAITKEKVIEIAKKYFTSNFLAFYSKMGFPEKDKVEKPGYEPLVSNTNAKSEYHKHFDNIPSIPYKPKFIDFKKDIVYNQHNNNAHFYGSNNPVNKIFELELSFGIGVYNNPKLEYAAEIMNYAAPKGMTVNEFKLKMAELGVSYNFSASNLSVNLYLTGLESEFASALKLINQLIANPVIDDNKIEMLVTGAKTNRKMETSEARTVAGALNQYIKYDTKSEYLNRLSVKEIKNLNTDSLAALYKNAMNYELTVFYTGKTNPKKIDEMTLKLLQLYDKKFKKSVAPEDLTVKKYTEPTVFFVNKKKALQSNVFILINGEAYDYSNPAVIEAFNQYFGGGFSGLVLQEIREYRSMAYTAAATYKLPNKKGNNAYFQGYVGTQADKTIDALIIFEDLLKNMPQKKERMEMIKNYLKLSTASSMPNFRAVPEYMHESMLKGYSKDPAIAKMQQYDTLTFDDIVKFYESQIKNKPIVIAIVGNKKRIDKKELAKFGKIVKVKEKQLFTN